MTKTEKWLGTQAALVGASLLDTPKAAEIIDMSASWLEHDRQKSSPEIPFVRMGSRAVRYRVSDLLAYSERQLGKPMAAAS